VLRGIYTEQGFQDMVSHLMIWQTTSSLHEIAEDRSQLRELVAALMAETSFMMTIPDLI